MSRGLKEDAESCFRRVEESINPKALYNLGIHFMAGQQIEKDPTRGIRLIKKAAHLGHPQAIDDIDFLQSPQ